ncbi:hypothetical protein BJF78_22420 [Pseudonocardia sp. CNS-139]|nr:hypothetical protein BJF78_22420 [Pseudonocardia sp. CNS-139]
MRVPPSTTRAEEALSATVSAMRMRHPSIRESMTSRAGRRKAVAASTSATGHPGPLQQLRQHERDLRFHPRRDQGVDRERLALRVEHRRQHVIRPAAQATGRPAQAGDPHASV